MTENATDTAQGEWEREGVGVGEGATGTAWQIGLGDQCYLWGGCWGLSSRMPAACLLALHIKKFDINYGY